jgi:hypothetical protein
MVYDFGRYGIHELTVRFDFDAEIATTGNFNPKDFDLCWRSVSTPKDGVVFCECTTDDIYIDPRDLPNADVELKRFLEEFYPEIDFLWVEIKCCKVIR